MGLISRVSSRTYRIVNLNMRTRAQRKASFEAKIVIADTEPAESTSTGPPPSRKEEEKSASAVTIEDNEVKNLLKSKEVLSKTEEKKKTTPNIHSNNPLTLTPATSNETESV